MSDDFTHFNAGDDVPEWLVDVEPAAPGAPRPRVTFTVDVTVIDFGDNYMVAPKHGAPKVLISVQPVGSSRLRVFSNGKNVRIPTGWMLMSPEGAAA